MRVHCLFSLVQKDLNEAQLSLKHPVNEAFEESACVLEDDADHPSTFVQSSLQVMSVNEDVPVKKQNSR